MNKLILEIKKHKTVILLLLLIVFHFFSHCYWTLHHHVPVEDVEIEHVSKSTFIYTHLKNSLQGLFSELNKMRYSGSRWPDHRPPFWYLPSALFSCLFGFSFFKMNLSFFLFFLILLLSTYLIAKTIANRKTGRIAVLFVSFHPIVFHYSHIYNQDFALAAMVSLGFYFLIRCNNFEERKYAFLLGMAFGLGALTKPTFVCYLSIPLAILIIYSLFKVKPKEAQERKTKKSYQLNWPLVINLFLFLIPFLILVWFWYGQRVDDMIGRCSLDFFRAGKLQENWPVESLFPASLSLRGALFYLVDFYKRSGLLIVLAILIAIPGFCKSKVRYKNLLVSWIFFSYLIFTLIDTKYTRYAIPIMPAIGIFFAIGILQIKRSFLKRSSTVVLALLLMYQFSYLSFGVKVESRPLSYIHKFLLSNWQKLPNSFWVSGQGRKYSYFFEKVFASFKEKQNLSKRIARYYNYLACLTLKNGEMGPGISPLEYAFVCYLLTKNPNLLFESLSGEEICVLFLHDRFYYTSYDGKYKSWPDKNEVMQELKIKQLGRYELNHSYSCRSRNSVVLVDEVTLGNGVYKYLYGKKY